tara:strand:- start:10 stop:330 length:321 start_codon:yes stop_codon:yes gene_type:complete
MTNTTNNNILNVMYNNHRILIDKITEYDYNGDMAVVKKMCTVIRYTSIHDSDDATPMIFNVSPYTSLVDMHTMARVWIDCGCPMDCDEYAIARKWTKGSLHEWVAS